MQISNWIKWHHLGVPDEMGESRELVRSIFSILGHCETCTALSGCYFVFSNKPAYPQHPFCDCELLFININEDNLTAVCDIRKFTEYLFQIDNSHGKTYLFEGWGYNIGDSESLKEEFEIQAKEKYFNGEYELQSLDKYSQRITIEIALQDKKNNFRMIRTGWMVKPSGKITCTTPFSGVAE